MFLSLLCLAASPARGIIPNVPFQVVQPTANHSSLRPVPQGLSWVSDHDGPISIVSVVGPYHSGKSFLLNALQGRMSVFPVGRQTSPETMGIWLCRTELKASDGSEVWLMDSEGFFGPGVSESYDAKIFTVSTLIAAHLVYNTVKVIDQQQVRLLEMLAHRAQLFRTRSSVEAERNDSPDFLRSQNFPTLTWVVEDFFQEYPQEFRGKDGATAWLKSYLSAGSSDRPDVLTQLYGDLQVRTLFLPATAREELVDLSKLTWGQLTPQFRQDLDTLRRDILRTLSARRVEGVPMTGATLARTIQFVVQALQRGQFHELPTLWKTWAYEVAGVSLQDAEAYFSSLLASIDVGQDPLPLASFNSEVEQARVKTVEFYTELLHNFEVPLELEDLRHRMGKLFTYKLTLYYERVQRWVSVLTLQAKEELMNILSPVALPVHPDSLARIVEEASAALVDAFGRTLTNFSAQTSSPPGQGKRAHMPNFVTDPEEQLASDLRSLWAMKELENEQKILDVFKGGVLAAEDHVERELSVHQESLLGKERMLEVLRLAEEGCWQVFETRLAKYPWISTCYHYKTHRALVQTETLDARFTKFAVNNTQRLTKHFRRVLDPMLNVYREKKASIVLPASETDIERAHAELASSMHEWLDAEAKGLSDTDIFGVAVREVQWALEDGFSDLQKKNVDLWKASSDEVTRCAARKSHASDKQCGFLCAYNKIPWMHHETNKQHFLECFESTHGHVPLGIQHKIFEHWFNTDMSGESARVWKRFYVSSAVLGGLPVFLFVLAISKVGTSRSLPQSAVDPRVDHNIVS